MSQYPPTDGPGYPPPGYPYPPPYVAVPNPAYYGPPPPSHVGWAVVAIIFFWPLAIPAFIASNKIGPAWMVGDVATAVKASADTKKFGVIALCLGLGLVVLWLVFALTAFATFTRF